MADVAVRRVIEIDVKASAQAVATMRQMAADTEAMEKRFAALQSAASGWVTTLIGAFSVGAIIQQFRETTNALDEMGKRSERLGIATEELSALTYQAKLANVSAQDLDAGITTLNKNLANLGDKTSTGSKALQALGITTKDPMRAMEQLADAFSHMESGAEKSAIATAIFKTEAGKMITVLNDGADGIRRAREEADAYGITVREDMVRSAQAFNDAMTRLGAAFDGFKIKALGPALEGLATLIERFYGAGTAALSFKDKLALAFPGDYNEKITTAQEQLKNFQKQLDDLEKRSSTAQFFRGTTKENERAMLQGSIDQTKAYIAEQERLIALGHKVADAQDAVNKGRKDAANIDTEAAARAAAYEVQMQRLAQTFAGMSAEGKIAALTQQLKDLQTVEDQGRITHTAAAVAREKLTREILKQGDAYDQLRAELMDEDDATQRLEDREMALNQMYLEGGITLDKYIQKWTETDDKLHGHMDTLDQTKDAYMKLGEAIEQAVQGWSGRTAQAIVDFTNGVNKSMHDLVNNILQEFEKMTIQILVLDPIFRSFGALLRGMASGGGGADFGYQGAKGGVFEGGNVLPFARGGVVRRPTLFQFAGGTGLMGEAGPEAIMPLKRSATGALGVESRGGNVSVTVINNTDSNVKVQQGRGANDERAITIMVEQSVQDAFSRGRFDSLMSATYGLNRRGR